MNIYPDCPYIARKIEVGGLTKVALIQKMHQQSILLNDFAKQLLVDERFTTSDSKYHLETIELSVKELGFSEGATFPQLINRIGERHLKLCPPELGPYLRLSYLDQIEGNAEDSSQPHQAPSGSITIASVRIDEDDRFPKGFYLRNMNGRLWLRGYIADDKHIWNADDRFIFCKE